jgi:hypothetical protein
VLAVGSDRFDHQVEFIGAVDFARHAPAGLSTAAAGDVSLHVRRARSLGMGVPASRLAQGK